MKACTVSSNHSCTRTPPPNETISLVRFFSDITIIILLGVAILLITLFATPFRRGFFCDDDSIRFPHKESSIPSALVAVAALGLPIIVITMSELVLYRIDPERRRSKTFIKWDVPLWIRRWCHAVSVFLFGAAITKLLVDTAKYTLGGLRPHFLNVCLPDVDCNKPGITLHDYIDNYECTGSNMELIKEARMSFPSGHAALAFYSATFTILYLEQMMTWRGSSLLRHTIQAVLLLAAWMTSLSRVSDFMHHWSDVLAGMLLGIISAFLMHKFGIYNRCNGHDIFEHNALYVAYLAAICAAGDLTADWCCMWCSPCEKTYAFSEQCPVTYERECYEGMEDGTPGETSPSRQ